MFSKKTDWTRYAFSAKLGAIYSAFFIISAISLFALAYYFISNIIEQREREGIIVRTQEYVAWLEEGGVKALNERFYEQAAYIKDVYFVQLLGPGAFDHALFVSVPANSESFHSNLWSHIDPRVTGVWHTVETRDRKSSWTIVSTPLRNNIVLQIGKRSSESYELLSYFRTLFFWFAIPILFLGLLVGGFLTFRMLSPIRSIIQTVQKIISTGEMKQRVQERKETGELDQLVKLFNRMLEKNESLIQAMRNSLDNVAHDLRTPMTRLRGIAELSLSNPDDHGASLEALTDCMEESEKVVSLLNTLMDISEAEAGVMHLDLTMVSISDVIKSVADLYEFVAEEKSIQIAVHIPQELITIADKNRLQQALANLLDNAIKYSASATSIDIHLKKKNHSVSIEITDQGMGIPGDEIDQIWNRLYRGDQSRSQKGMGLGLSFVKAIIAAHQGTVMVDSIVNQGSCFTVQLPLKNQEI